HCIAELPAEIGVHTFPLLPVVRTESIPALALHSNQAVEPVGHFAGGYSPLTESVAAAVKEYFERWRIVGGTGNEIDGTTEGAGTIGECIGAACHDDMARAERIGKAVMVIAVGSGDRQPILQQLDAAAVVILRIEIGTANGNEGGVAAATHGPYAGYVAQHVSCVIDIAFVQRVAIHHCHATRRK